MLTSEKFGDEVLPSNGIPKITSNSVIDKKSNESIDISSNADLEITAAGNKGQYPRKLSRGINSIKVKSAIPKIRQNLLKWNGWGYKDSRFLVSGDTITFSGNRYPICGQELPNLKGFIESKFGTGSVKNSEPLPPLPAEESCWRSIIPRDVLEELTELDIDYSVDGLDRRIRSRGQNVETPDVQYKIKRIVDVVVWPTCHEEVVEIVKMADRRNIVIIPIGGATSVSGAVDCPEEEERPIISLDTTQMNEILWIDLYSLSICCESGILGQDLERELKKIGYTTGHEPDSLEFSSLGGWVATRGSGMKKNTYGNIEDLVVHVRMVTPRGVVEKNCKAPRVSCGPDMEQMILGSEGSFGVITEVVMKIRPLPDCTRYGCLIFPDFESGFACMRDIAIERCLPSNIRLLDSEQSKVGKAFFPVQSYGTKLMYDLSLIFLTKFLRFDSDKLCMASVLFEGTEEEVNAKEKKINQIAYRHWGLPAGRKHGERGYALTFVVAYIRDLMLENNLISDSFETSVPWNKSLSLCRNVKQRIIEECKKRALHHVISYRLSQSYDTGCCIYFYLSILGTNLSNASEVLHEIFRISRKEIFDNGGSISHHHGVGKLRRLWYKDAVSRTWNNMYRATKVELDPNNIFATRNLTEELAEVKSTCADDYF